MSELVERARALADAATPGPWSCHGEDVLSNDGLLILSAFAYGTKSDADFCSASRELVPALCAALEAAEATIHELRAELAAAEYLLAEGEAHNPEDFGLVPVDQLREMTARAERAEAAARWIPVGERLPDRAKRVLLFTSANETYTGWLDWVSKSGEIYFTVYELPGKIIHINHATYWRELPARPEPPKVQS